MALGVKSSVATLATLLPLFLQRASADIDYEARCEDYRAGICITSFTWCDDTGSCSYPENVYPQRPLSSRAGLLWEHEYDLSWTRSDDEYPVQVQWTVSAPDSESEAMAWKKNFTNGETSFTFKFSDLAEEIDDFNATEVKGRASGPFNHIVISQPGLSYEDLGEDLHGDAMDISDMFVLFDEVAMDFLDTQRKFGEDDMYDTWKLGVGIGVGLGVPLFMAAAFIAGLFLGRRKKTVVAQHKSVSE